jgi:hypothetical protein
MQVSRQARPEQWQGEGKRAAGPPEGGAGLMLSNGDNSAETG